MVPTTLLPSSTRTTSSIRSPIRATEARTAERSDYSPAEQQRSITRPRAASPVSIDDEISDEGEGLAVLGLRERAQRTLRGLRVAVGAVERVLDALVLHHEEADLLGLLGVQRAQGEQVLEAVQLGPGRPV